MYGMSRFLGLGVLLLAVGCGHQRSQPIVVDGTFADWSSDARRVVDAAGDAAGATDVLGLSGTRAGDQLFLRLQIAAPSNLQKPDEGGGLQIEIRGRDETLVVDTGARQVTRDGQPVSWGAVGYVGLPTHAATDFEIRLRAPRGPLRIQIGGSDELPHPLHVAGHGTALPPREVRVARGDVPLRVVVWNVLQGGAFGDAEREEAGRSVLEALDADVLLLQEVWGVENLAARVREVCGDDWNVHAFSGVAVASRLPLTPLELYPPVELDNRRRPKEGDTWSVMRNLFVGVDTPVGPLVFVSAHWKCCGYTGSDEDITRMDDALVALKSIWRLRDAAIPARPRRDGSLPHKAAVPERFCDAPIMIAGDYNLVGSRTPLDMLLTQGFVDLVPLQSDEWNAATWRSLGDKPGGYPQGRLDIVLADQALNVSRSFIADLGEPTRVSDHLPIVVDIAE